MTKAEILKKEILRQYRSVRQFAMEMNIPYSTLVTALERGIEGMAYGTVIKMCDKLSLNPVDFSSLERDASLGAQLLENRVMQNYVKLNQTLPAEPRGIWDIGLCRCCRWYLQQF